MNPSDRQRILVICTGNSARSQMAEAWLRHLAGGQIDVTSAGTHPAGLHPLVPEVMAEMGVSTEGQRSKPVDDFADRAFDLVVTVCDDAAESCPVFPNAARREHWPFQDPVSAPPARQPEVFRRVRDEIGARVEKWIGSRE